jgi:flagellar hook assembly protein FlgD
MSRAKTIGSAALLVIVTALTMFGAAGVGAADEVGNETVEVTNETESIVVDVSFNDSAGDDNVSVAVDVEDSNGTVVDNTTIDGVNDGWASATINASEYETGNYTVVADATVPDPTNATYSTGSDYVDRVDIATQDAAGGGGGVLSGGGDLGAGAIAALVVIGAAIVAKRDD